MAKAAPYEPPPDPDFVKLASDCAEAWGRDEPSIVAFDTETTGLAHFDTPFCVTVAWRRDISSPFPGTSDGIEAHYIELGHPAFDGKAMACNILENASTLIGHHLKFDLQKVLLADIYTGTLHSRLIEDTEILSHLLDEHRPKGLKDLAVSVLGYEDIIEIPYKTGPKAAAGESRSVPREKHEIEEAKKWAKKEHGLASVKQVGYHLLPRGVVVPYAIKDALWTLELYEKFRPAIHPYPELLELYEQELELLLVLLDMQDAGMRVRPDYVKDKIVEYTNKTIQTDTEIQSVVGKPVGKGPDDFNPASNPQITEFFTAAGFARDNYDAEALRGIEHPLAPLILARRKDEKILSTYFVAIRDEEQDGILHPSYRQNVTTGRMASGKEQG